jgi:carboxymethylenebutenolidase
MALSSDRRHCVPGLCAPHPLFNHIQETPMLNTDLIADSQALLDAKTSQGAATRRTALKAALGVGYAASVLPVMAQTAIKTPADGLTAGEVMIDVNGFKMPAYRAAPAGKTGLPVVLVLSEIFGVHEYIADTARRFAKAGYLAIAPELFVRQGDAQSYGEMAKLIAEVISKVPDGQVMADLDATVKWAAANGGDAKKLGVTGFCWGGRQTWLYAAHNPAVKAGVAWYGRLVGQTSDLTPKHPVDVAAGLHGPVLGLYGAADTGIPLDTVDKMKAALAAGNAAAKASSFVVYPDAPHAFHADYRPSFRKEPAEDGWKRALAWFQQHGVV